MMKLYKERSNLCMFGCPTGVHSISELGQPLRSFFGLYRQFTTTKAAEECGPIITQEQGERFASNFNGETPDVPQSKSLRKNCLGVPELCSNKQTKRQTNRDNNFVNIYIDLLESMSKHQVAPPPS